MLEEAVAGVEPWAVEPLLGTTVPGAAGLVEGARPNKSPLYACILVDHGGLFGI